MNTIPDLDHTPPAFNGEVLEAMLDRLYHIVPMAKGAADPATDETLRKECLSRIYDETIVLGKTLMLIQQSVDAMDEQILGLIAHAKRNTTASLN